MKQLFTAILSLITVQLILSASVNAQTPARTGKIKGKVVDEQKKSASYATVNLLHASDSTIVKRTLTTADGDFIFEEILSGIYLVSVEWTGYKKSFSSLTIGPEKNLFTLETITLLPHGSCFSQWKIILSGQYYADIYHKPFD